MRKVVVGSCDANTYDLTLYDETNTPIENLALAFVSSASIPGVFPSRLY